MIVSITLILIIIFYFLYLKNIGGMGKYVKTLSNKKRGLSCYLCNLDFQIPIPDEGLKICKCCERDQQIKLLLKPLKYKYSLFEKLFFHEKFENFSFIFILAALLLVISNIIFIFFHTKLGFDPNWLFSVYWLLMIYRVNIVMRSKLKISTNRTFLEKIWYTITR
jgi:hypothetical protein